MHYYLFKFSYNNETLISGIAYNLDKIYRKNNPLYCDNNNMLKELCDKKDIDFFETKFEYIEFPSEVEAKHELELVKSGKSNLKWNEFIPKTYNFDKSQYMRFLNNKLETCRKINHYDKSLHLFLIKNFNTSDEYIYFEEEYNKPSKWDELDKKAQKKYIQKYLHLDKKYDLTYNCPIKVFSGYGFDSNETKIIIRYKIASKIIPFLIASMYNTVTNLSHTLNKLNTQKIPINKTELPYYHCIKPIVFYYTIDKYEELYKKKK